MVPEEGLVRLSLAPRADLLRGTSRSAIHSGNEHRARTKKGQGNSLTLVTRLVPEEGLARLSLRPSRATAFAAGLGADALPCVALFLLFVGAPRPFSPLLPHQEKQKGL